MKHLAAVATLLLTTSAYAAEATTPGANAEQAIEECSKQVWP